MEILLIILFVFIVVPLLALYALITMAAKSFNKVIFRIKVDN